MTIKQSILVGLVGAVLSACTAQQMDQPRTNKNPVSTAAQPSGKAKGCDSTWACSTETALKRRAQDAGLRVREVSCAPLTCKLTFVVQPTVDEKRHVDTWLKANWTFRWTLDAGSVAGSEAQLIEVTLYRHPADEVRTAAKAFSSLSGGAADACEQGADCRHPNWDQPRLCERNATECPALDWNGTKWCFESLTLACNCAKLRGPDVTRQLSNCDSDGYPY